MHLQRKDLCHALFEDDATIGIMCFCLRAGGFQNGFINSIDNRTIEVYNMECLFCHMARYTF